MKSRIFLAAMMTALLAMPATTALAADQDVDVQVLPADILGINVHHDLGFQIEIDQSAIQPFGMDITNTTDGGWKVTVDGPDLQSYSWNEQNERVHTANTIAKSNVVVTGGDMCWTHECDPAADSAIIPSSRALGDTLPIMVGTAEAYGMFGFNEGYQPTVQVTIPLGSVSDSYYTTLTYTIMAP